MATLGKLADTMPRSKGRVHLDLSEPVAELVLDNPTTRNALSLAMMSELARSVLRLSQWDGCALIIRSEGPVFCSGGHLGELRRAIGAGEPARQMCEAMTAVLDGLLSLPQISVCAVQGPALGGGAELLTATDARVISPTATIHFVQARLGIAPGWGGAHRLASIVGRRRALRILGTALPVEPSEAEIIGLADAVVTQPIQGAREWLEPFLDHPPQAVRAVKRQLIDPANQAEVFGEVWGSVEHTAALNRLRQAR